MLVAPTWLSFEGRSNFDTNTRASHGEGRVTSLAIGSVPVKCLTHPTAHVYGLCPHFLCESKGEGSETLLKS
jgi:hypothetical protein